MTQLLTSPVQPANPSELAASPSDSPLPVDRSQQASPPNLLVRWIHSIDELESMIPAWETLSATAMRRNISFEPSFLIPALQFLGSNKVRVLIIEDRSAKTPKNRLVGLIPFEKKRLFHLPISTFEIWKHNQCFDTTPLLREGWQTDAWQGCCQFLKKEGAGLLSLDTVSAEPEFMNVLENESNGHLAVFRKNEFERAAFRPANTSDEYMQTFISKKARKKFRQQIRRLSGLGEVTVERSHPNSPFDKLAEEFLRLESSGWKGTNKSALACDQSTLKFYKAMIARSANSGSARFLTLRLNGDPIAMLSDLQSGQTVFSYKTAFDETYSEFSPGIQAEFRNIEFLHADDIELADSCTASDNATLNRIWGQRLKFQSLIIALKPGIPRFVTAVMPRMQSIYRRLKGQRK